MPHSSSVKIKRRSDSPLKKKARHFRGYPAATVAYYGPDDTRASKIAVGIVHEGSDSPIAMERWFVQEGDIRKDRAIATEISQFLRLHGVKSVVMTETIIGCPHEEGIHYPEGGVCPMCPFWAHRNRWTGEILQ